MLCLLVLDVTAVTTVPAGTYCAVMNAWLLRGRWRDGLVGGWLGRVVVVLGGRGLNWMRCGAGCAAAGTACGEVALLCARPGFPAGAGNGLNNMLLVSLASEAARSGAQTACVWY
jgi:hypothetical protein